MQSHILWLFSSLLSYLVIVDADRKIAEKPSKGWRLLLSVEANKQITLTEVSA